MKHVAQGLWLVLLTGLALGALMWATPQEAQAQGRQLLIVPFERDNVDDLFYSTLMKQARDAAGGAAEYVTLDPIDSDLNELLFGVGCEDASVECMQMVAETFGAQVIMYGKLWGNDRGIFLEVRIFDAQLGEDLLEEPVSRSFESKDKEQLLKMAIGEIQQIFYPFTGELTVSSTEPATTIMLDGAEVGNTSNGPVKLTGLRLGEHVLTAAQGDTEVTQTIVLMHDTPENITVDPTKPIEDPGGGSGGEGFAHVGSVTAFSVGGAALLTGAVFSVLVNSQNSEVERLSNQPIPDATANNDALQSGERLNALQFVFYGVGATAIAVGAVLYLFEGDDSSEEGEGNAYIAPMMTGDGVGASIGGTF